MGKMVDVLVMRIDTMETMIQEERNAIT